MSGVIQPRGLTAAIKTLLESETGRPVGNTFAPLKTNGDAEDHPYLVISSGDTEQFFGPAFVAPEADACLCYVIASIGVRADQVEWLQEKVMLAILDKVSGHGIFINSLSFANHTIIGRTLGLKGRIGKEGKTFLVEDIYKFDVSSPV